MVGLNNDRALISFAQSGMIDDASALLDSECILHHSNGSENKGIVVSIKDLSEVENLLSSNGFSCSSKELSNTVSFVLKPTYDIPNILSHAMGILTRSKVSFWVITRLCLCVDEADKERVEWFFSKLSVPFTIK